MNNRFRTKKFLEPYEVNRIGRGNQQKFKQSRKWHINTAPKVWQTYKHTGCIFVLVWADPNTAKSHFSITFGEATPFGGTNAILVHSNNLVEQHNETLDYYRQQGFVTKPWNTYTIHKLYSVIKKLKEGKEVDEELEYFVLNLQFIVVDECHKYGKGKDAVMFQEVMDYLKTHGNLKLIMGTTATGKYIDKIWSWADCLVNRARFTFRPDPKDLAEEDWTPGSVEYINVDSQTTIFDKQFTDSIGARADDPTFSQYCADLINTDPDDAIDNLVQQDHKLKFRNDKQFRLEQLAYQDNRVDVSIDHYIKKELGAPVIINVRGVNNAIWYQDQYQAKLKKLGYRVVAWNGEGKNNHKVYKNNEKKLLKDLENPKHPLKVVITNGMLKEGTNREIQTVYQCAFTPGGAESSIQVGNRGKYTVIMLDAMNVAKLPKTGWRQSLQDTLEEAGFDRTPEDLINAFQAEQERLKAGNPNHKTPQVADKLAETFFDNDYETDSEETDSNVQWHTILHKDVWVKDVNYKGNHKTSKMTLHNNHQTLFEALDIVQETAHA